MTASSPQQVIALIDKAFHAADLEALVALYDEAGVQVDYVSPTPGKEIRGREALRNLYQSMLKPGLFEVKQLKTHVVEADGIALYTSLWSIRSNGQEPKTYTASIVLRRQPDGSWKDLIDSSPSVLDW